MDAGRDSGRDHVDRDDLRGRCRTEAASQVASAFRGGRAFGARSQDGRRTGGAAGTARGGSGAGNDVAGGGVG
ncbi:hypothetical protein GCM10009838_76050 [Catenulispora subtropica]|uniref:Uncharacterized protein n=1 Tax=Catenulispora subtropica TaxID=450798 RepID=A0ABN2T6G1_9ACTN